MQLALSATLHTCLLLLLATLSIAPRAAAPRRQPAHVALIAPAPRITAKMTALPPPAPGRPAPRAFVAPTVSAPAPPSRVTTIETYLPQIDVEPAPRAVPSAHPAALPPPPKALRASGFSNTAFSSTPGTSAPAPDRPAITRAGFGDASTTTPVSIPAAAAPTPAIAAPTTPVEIISKPKPVYTSEARELHIEGEVALQVLFAATGETRVLRVLESLGHGLDQAAESSATRIQFRPASRAGVPVDQVATVRIVFRLAY